MTKDGVRDFIAAEYTLSENYVHGLAAFAPRLKNFESPHSSRGSSPGLPAGNSVKGCACWAVFDIIREPHNESAYDLFIGTCVGAWADPRVFVGGHWNLEGTPRELRPLHYVAGGHFYATGDTVVVPGYAE